MEEVPGVSAELPVFEDVLVKLVADLVEVIHVELPDEGGEVLVPEVGGQDFLLEAFNVEDGEIGAFFVPADDVGVGLVLSGAADTSRIWKALEMKMEGPECFSLFQRPLRQASLDSECSE